MSRGKGQDVRRECLSRHLRRRILQQLSRMKDYRLYRHPSCWPLPLVLHPDYIRECAELLEGQTVMGTDGILRSVTNGQIVPEVAGSGTVAAEALSALIRASIPPELEQAMDEAEQAGALSGLYHLLLHSDCEAFERSNRR